MSFDLDRPYAVSGAEIDAFRRDGFVRLKQFFAADELDHYSAEITRLTMALNRQTRPLAERSTYGKAFVQITNLWEHGGAAREFVFGKRLARIAATLLEVQGVRLYHDQALYKEAGGGFTPAHADQYYWPLDTDRSITAWVPLQAVPAEMGPIVIMPGARSSSSGATCPSRTRARRGSRPRWSAETSRWSTSRSSLAR